MRWLCIASVLTLTPLLSAQENHGRPFKVFPTGPQSVAGVFQVSSLNSRGQPQYAFNASEARDLCSQLDVIIASKAQVREALRRGLETCRFGWVDEHFAVIPRIKPLPNCGQSRTGLVTWRTAVTAKFDVFCFNESDAETQWKDTTTNVPLSSTRYSGPTASAQTEDPPSPWSLHPSSTFAPETVDSEAEAARRVGSAQSSAGGKAVLITSTCALLLVAIVVIVYFKMKRICTRGFDIEQQQQQQQEEEEESIEAEDWTALKNVEQNKCNAELEEEIEEEEIHEEEEHEEIQMKEIQQEMESDVTE